MADTEGGLLLECVRMYAHVLVLLVLPNIYIHTYTIDQQSIN